MRQAYRGMLSLLWLAVALESFNSAQAQEQSAWFGDVTLGPGFPDRRGNDLLAGHGMVVRGRVGRHLGSTISAIVELTHASFQPSDVAFLQNRTAFASVPCNPDDPFCGVGGGFSGPVRMAIAGAGMEAWTGDETAALFASLAPALYWIYDRAPGTNAVSGGLGLSLGGGLRIAEPMWAVVDVHYHRLFSEGDNPRWVVPLSLGLQLR